MDHYTKSLPYELGLTSRVLQEAAVELFKRNNFPVSIDEYTILDCLYIYPDIIQMQLAKLILKGKGHTGKILKSLEDKHLIIRTPVKKGSKIVMKLEMTGEGMKLYKAISTKLEKLVGEIDSGINVKISEVITLLQSIRKDAEAKFNIKFE